MSALSAETATGLHSRALRAAANDTPRHGRVFTCDDAQVTYLAHPAIGAAVAAHLFYDTHRASPTGIRAPGWRVTCVVDPDLWPAMVEPLQVRWLPVLDYGDPGYLADIGDHGQLVLVRATGSIIAVDHAEQMAVIVAPTPAGAFVESYKTVRHLLTTQLTDRGAIPLHASAVAAGGNVLAFCGRKGVGKSSALLHALLSHVPGLSWVANDRLLVRPERGAGDIGTVAARCWPTVAGFGGTLLSSVAGLDRLIDPGVHLRGGGLAYLLLDLPLVEKVGTPEEPGSVPGKIRLTPAELTATFGVPPSPGGRLAVVVAVDLDPSRGRSTLTEVTDPAKKAGILAENLGGGIPTHPDWLGVTSAPAAAADSAVVLAGYLDGVRVLTLAAGRDYHDVVRGLCGALHDPSFTVDPAPSWHHGVYAACLADNALLTVHKNRGPYTGMLDLPGGSPEPGEDRGATLDRELLEETGGRIHRAGPWHEFDLAVARASDGRPLAFRHHGYWRDVDLAGVTAPTKTDEDTDGLHWLPVTGWRERDDLSAPLRAVLADITADTGPAGMNTVVTTAPGART